MSNVYWYSPFRKTQPDLRDVIMADMNCITLTDYGIVYSSMAEHNERLLRHHKKKELNYNTHYYIIVNGMMWRGKSWGGTMSHAGMRMRAHEFSRRVMRLVPDEATVLPVSPSIEMKRELHRTKVALSKLVELCMTWISSTFPRYGLIWSSPDDYPSALRNAIAHLEETGGEADNE